MASDAGTILVLDDDPGILALETRTLQRSGYAVLATSSPEEAMEHVRRGDVALAVLDYQLEGRLTGLDFFKAVRAAGHDLPAVLVTGFSDERKLIEALRAGVRDVIPKVEGYLDHLPLSVERVMKQVRADRQLAESEALRSSEERLRLALEAGRMGTWDWDLRSGQVVWSSLHFSLMGYEPQATAPSYEQWIKRVHPDDTKTVEDGLKRCVEGSSDYAAIFRVIWSDGAIHWLDARGKCQLDKMGRAIRMHGVLTDITERKHAEVELTHARERAEQASRTKDEFLAVLSHELRTPLTPVLTAVQLVESESGLSSEGRESLQLIRRNVELEARLIDDMLDVTRIARGKVELQLQSVSAHEIIRHVLATCDADFRNKQIAVTTEFLATRPQVLADPTRLQQIFWNLLKNAAKFTPVGGRVEIETRDIATGGIWFRVRDNGPGIEPEVLTRLFKPFEQGGRETTRVFGGLGLGLSISKGLVDQHGGTLTAESEGRGKGATFTLTLPAATPASANAAASADGSATDVKEQPLSILLVEDHEDTRKVMSRLLRRMGHEVSTAGSVAAAIQIADATPFDLLVSDIGLPDGSGLDLMRQIAEKRSIKGIVMSGFGMDEDVRRSKEAGFAEHLIKPVSMARLEAVIARLAGRD